MNSKKLIGLGIALAAFTGNFVRAHEGHDHGKEENKGEQPTIVLPQAVEKKGPVKIQAEKAGKISGAGYWTFAPATELVPLPEEAKPHVKGAHGTVLVDPSNGTLYWGLQSVGWIAYTENLKKAAVIKGDAAFARGNLHGSDLFPRRGKKPLIVAADDAEGEVYVTDTSFEKAEVLSWPRGSLYSARNQFHPTDAAFVDGNTIYITDGYGKAYVMGAQREPLRYDGIYLGGKEMSQTPHGITYIKERKNLLISARPEGQIKELKPKLGKWLETLALPKGSTVCDVDIWGDYALAPCLNGPDNTPGPIYIVNLKTKKIVSTIKPKEELGYTDAQHIHDACWYVQKKGRTTEVYVVFTNWNPGGIGALKLVGQPE
jgi:hypothetical protein